MTKLNVERVKELRISLGYTQQFVAEYLSCSKSGYCYMEQGKRQPSLEKLGKLSTLYNVATDELLEQS
ncbi:helix-turn-helix transcriptional regulator [Bacillus cereus]|uniref:XRE family transcriptional regulator n=1 Tax=Bacillus thuringiensis TaxID=1428 RepID=A0ABD6SL61_BACTU|nr:MULTISPECIES: helix-turn-helix transcriptional regulator [Bacillus]TKV45641.1 XRE family transcriptional regulator [Bacillus sp. PIC28]AJQ59275.1 transcriptional regulator [Bacillus thuringiensis serovar morrisoni]AMR85029.1 transcriptional regulator [Bacillus thuringiensis]AZV66466.1 XRE family transcriptional regulator [Bacillus cereus]EKS7859810.1 helix-turn-helix transcriptional regulator [Bacillus cereus]